MKDFLKTALIFAGGAAVGAAVAMFLTPESGEEMRKDARRIAGEAKKRLADYYEQLKENIEAEISKPQASEETEAIEEKA